VSTYYVSQSDNDNYDDQSRRFKHRYESTQGKPVAQELYNQLRDAGEFVRLVEWRAGEWVEIERANG
jgi:hypothetical protein